MNSGGIGSVNDGDYISTLYIAVLYPLVPQQGAFVCTTDLFATCQPIGNPGAVFPGPPALNGTFTCDTPPGDTYLEFQLTGGDGLAPLEEATAAVYEPEPSVLPLLALGLFGVVGLGLRRKRLSAY